MSGTNLHHALMLSRKLLSREKGGTRQILVITDGEPTAHLEGEQAYFSYPPSYRTELETLKEGAALHPGRHRHQHVSCWKTATSWSTSSTG